ncbi:MAG: WYL domain-containing protein [Microthrixaceae bacterium]
MSTKKLERQLNLIAALMDSARPLRAEEIHQRVEGYPESNTSFHRAFERDKDDLRAMGLPILMEDLPGTDPPTVGYRMTDADYGMDDPELEADELAALHLATSIVRLRGLDDDSGLWKLGGAPAGGTGSPVSLSAEVPTPVALLPLFSAVSDRATATFDYRGAERVVDPERLEYQRGRWYLAAFDRDKGERRSFRVDRMGDRIELGAPGSAGSHEPPASEPSRRPWTYEEGPEDHVTLEVDALVAPVVRLELPDAELVEERPDGSIRLRVRLTRWEPFRSYVLSHLDHVEVLDPEWARADLVSWLRAVVAESDAATETAAGARS